MPGLSRHRRAAGAGSADGVVEAARRPRHLHPAVRHRRSVGPLRRRSAWRRRAQCRAASLRKGRAGGRRPRHHRGVAGRPDQAPRLRMAEGLAVHHSAQRLSPHHQRGERAGAAAVRHHGAERDEPARQSDFIFNCPYTFTERFSGAEDFFKPNDDVEPDPIRGLAMRRTNLIPDIVNTRAAARQPPLARLSARRAGDGRATASICGSASTRPAAIPRRTSTPPPPCSICVKGKGYTYTWPEDARHHAVAERQGRQGLAPGLRAGRHGFRRADERRLVPPAFRHRQGGACASPPGTARTTSAPASRACPASS